MIPNQETGEWNLVIATLIKIIGLQFVQGLKETPEIMPQFPYLWMWKLEQGFQDQESGSEGKGTAIKQKLLLTDLLFLHLSLA